MIRIVTDSTADLPDAMIKEQELEIIPLNVIIEGQSYVDGVDMSKDQFYAKMSESKNLPTTSQASPESFRERFQRILDNGDDVLYLGLSSTLSGTMQSARIGRELTEQPERVTIFDTMTVTFAQGMLATVATKLSKVGQTMDEIVKSLQELRNRQKLVFSVATLDNLRKSGRVSNLSFLFGSLLNIKPILWYDKEGVVQVFDRVRGKKNADHAVLRFFQENRPDPNYPIGVGHAADPSAAQKMKEFLAEHGFTNILDFEVSPVVGTHVGIGTIGIVFFGEK